MTTVRRASPDAMASPRTLDDALRAGEAIRARTDHVRASARADLPLRYWRQQAHLTTPATDAEMARKAVEGGTGPVRRALDRLGLGSADLADRLDVPRHMVAAALAVPARAPLVMLDGEDAIPPGDDAAQHALTVAATTFTAADWGTGGAATLRFYRPSGFNLDTSVRDLYTLLWRLRELAPEPAAFPLDGIVFPKIEHPEEVDALDALLGTAERALGLPDGHIRVAYLIESGWAASQLAEIARRAAPRLAGLIFGLADFSADLGLPAIGNDHALAAWARAEIVAVAGAAGVPAIDGMTLDYPVPDRSLSASANRTRWLDRMRLVFDDAVRARDLGMAGKWVGHPSQLFAVLLAYDAALTDEDVAREATKLEAYDAALQADRGATMIDGVMSDRATDRHARVLLRRAAAVGRFAPDRAQALGVISADELADAGDAFATRARAR